MYYQGKQIRATIPQLPEAKGTAGMYSSQKTSDKLLKVLTIGESTIAGVGVNTHEEGFSGALAKEISELFDVDVQWKVYARSGYTAREVTAEIIPGITENEADLIVIGLGANDAFTLNHPARWRTEIRSLIEALKAKFPEAAIIFCNMPPIKEFPAFTSLIKFTVGNLVEILGKELQKVVEDYQDVRYCEEKITLHGWIDKFKLSGNKEDFFSDGVHPSKLTYQIWAKAVAIELYKNERIHW